MNCDDVKKEMPSLYFGEASEDEREKLMAHIAKCPVCKQEWEDIRTTDSVMAEYNDEEPPNAMVFIAERPADKFGKIFSLLNFSGGLKWAAAAAVFALGLWIVKPSVSYEKGSFKLAFGAPKPAVPAGYADFEERIKMGKLETLKLVAQMITEESQNQRRDFTLTLAEFARSIDKQRKNDLDWIETGLKGVQRNTQAGIMMTNIMIEDLIKNASYSGSEAKGK